MKKITSLEYNTLIWFIIRACFVELTITKVLALTKQDSWISILIGIIIGLIPFSIFEYIKNKYPNYNYIILNKKLFKYGNIINLIILIGCIILSTCIFWILVHFANSLFLYKTNPLIISIAFIIPICYASTKEMHIISKVSLIIFYISVIFNIMIMTGLTSEIDISNIKPLFENKSKIIETSLIFTALNITKIFFLNIIPKNKVINHSSKINYLTYFITTINLLDIALSSVCIFGIDLATIYEYPAFQILKRVNILGIISKLESILAIEGIFSIFIVITIIIYYAKAIIIQTFKPKEKTNKYITISICSIILILNNIMFQTNEEANSFFIEPLIYIIYIIFVFLPLITLVKSLYHTENIK